MTAATQNRVPFAVRSQVAQTSPAAAKPSTGAGKSGRSFVTVLLKALSAFPV